MRTMSGREVEALFRAHAQQRTVFELASTGGWVGDYHLYGVRFRPEKGLCFFTPALGCVVPPELKICFASVSKHVSSFPCSLFMDHLVGVEPLICGMYDADNFRIKPLPTPTDLSRFPHTCRCGSPAYLGVVPAAAECSSPKCQYYRGPR